MARPDLRSAGLLTGTALTVFRLNSQLLSASEELARPAGLTAARWQVLDAVADAPKTVSAIARELGSARQSVQRIADVLVEQELAEYRPNPAHSRAKLLAPTGEGATALTRVGTAHDRLAAALVTELGEEETANALASLHLLSEVLERISPQR